MFIVDFIRSKYKDSTVQKKYTNAGSVLGEVVSYLYMGECFGFEKILNEWAKWEKEYAKRGYRAVSLDRFIEFGGYGKSIDDVIGQKREIEEEPIFHAQIYRENFLGKVKPIIDIEEITQDGKPQFGIYILPSTENPPKDN